MMHGEHQDVSSSVHLYQANADKRPRLEIEAAPGLLLAQTIHFTLAVRRWQPPQVRDRDTQGLVACDHMKRRATDLRKARAQNVMTTNDFIEGTFKDADLQRTFHAPAERVVISGVSRTAPVGEPHSALRRRQGERAIGQRSRSDRRGG